VSALIGPTSLLTGTLYYFGYVSMKAFYSYFGVSLSALNFSTVSYLVQSPDTRFKPVATLLIVLVVLLIIHRLLGLALERAAKSWARGVAIGLGIASAVLVVLGVLGMYGRLRGLGAPLALAGAGLLFEYGLWTASRHASPPPRVAGAINAGVNLRRGIMAALVLSAVFWAVTDLAHARGRADARIAELSLRLQSQAVVYSEKDLHLPGPEVAVTSLHGADSAYRFRYNGLRPLVYAHDRWFLLPVGWTHDNGSTVIVLQDDPERVRVDLAP
jgi:hypothetical protein